MTTDDQIEGDYRVLSEEDDIRTLFEEILNRIKTNEDPESLNKYRALVRKHVPFFMRSYLAAYLFKELHLAVPAKSTGRPVRKDKAERKREEPRRENPIAAEPRRDEIRRDEVRKHTLPENESVVLFFGIGRNRRAYARDLLAFITSESDISGDDVGELRVLDNFSFVQIRDTVAERAIAALNGKEFRGRAVAVNRAKPRREGGAIGTDEGDEAGFGSDADSE